jgi:hypothetical protein
MLSGVVARKIFRGWHQSPTKFASIHRETSHVILSILTWLVLLLSGLFTLNFFRALLNNAVVLFIGAQGIDSFSVFLYQVASRGSVSGTEGQNYNNRRQWLCWVSPGENAIFPRF